jgi:hypothetical protein
VDEGELAAILRTPGSHAKRGGGSVASILPVLAIHNPVLADISWTPWKRLLSVRRIAALAGISPNSVTAALALLEERGLLQRRRHPNGGHLYRLHARMFPQRNERYARIPGALIYGGVWALLPGNSYRHVYLALAARDAVKDPEAYGAGAENEGDITSGNGWKAVVRMRERHPVMVSQLVRDTGLVRNSVKRALGGLASESFALPGNGSATALSLVSIGPALDGGCWVAPSWRSIAEIDTALLEVANDAQLRKRQRLAVASGEAPGNRRLQACRAAGDGFLYTDTA